MVNSQRVHFRDQKISKRILSSNKELKKSSVLRSQKVYQNRKKLDVNKDLALGNYHSESVAVLGKKVPYISTLKGNNTKNSSIKNSKTPSYAHLWTLISVLAIVIAIISRITVIQGFRLGENHKPYLPPDNQLEKTLYEDLTQRFNFSFINQDKELKLDNLKTKYYNVLDGDTISGIADQFDISLDTLISFNKIETAKDLQVGKKLIIPNLSGISYEVRRGDNLTSIAQRYNVSFPLLLDVNDIKSDIIQPGQILLIPDGKLSNNQMNRVLGRLFIWPARGRLTSKYGYRNDPFTGVRKFHSGIDIANSRGTNVLASMRGTVALLGYSGIYGRYITLKHDEGFQTLYGHLDKINVKKGQLLKQGQIIGKMGTTGYSTGVHLHFSVYKDGEHINPLRYLEN